jgi:hypothetical protein
MRSKPLEVVAEVNTRTVRDDALRTRASTTAGPKELLNGSGASADNVRSVQKAADTLVVDGHTTAARFGNDELPE